jgi:hypothetical protein
MRIWYLIKIRSKFNTFRNHFPLLLREAPPFRKTALSFLFPPPSLPPSFLSVQSVVVSALHVACGVGRRATADRPGVRLTFVCLVTCV